MTSKNLKIAEFDPLTEKFENSVEWQLMKEQHNGKPVWKKPGDIHHVVCFVKLPESPDGHWAIADMDVAKGQEVCSETLLMPENVDARADKQSPPTGLWVSGRPWSHEKTFGSRRLLIEFE